MEKTRQDLADTTKNRCCKFIPGGGRTCCCGCRTLLSTGLEDGYPAVEEPPVSLPAARHPALPRHSGLRSVLPSLSKRCRAGRTVDLHYAATPTGPGGCFQ
ncbi:hypothetical protein Bbelb_303290 [Branchiostoma belcheri]|nr:hypothetical protein Bbelb_303290 [Branchiostoma belcheri]